MRHFPVSSKSCSASSPSVSPQVTQVLGSVQVASFHSCPNGSPSVSPQVTQVLGSVQVASSHSCSCPQADNATDIANVVSVNITFVLLFLICLSSA